MAKSYLTLRSIMIYIVLLMTLFGNAFSAILARDMGTEWDKLSVAGIKGLNIVLNQDSKRKTQSVIAIRDDVRLYGTDAANLAARFPANAFPSLKYLVGKSFDSPEAQRYRDIFPNQMINDERDGIAFKYNDTLSYSIHELIAMQFAYMKSLADITAEEQVLDAVVTVPPFFKAPERNAIMDAASIAGIRVIGLINDGTAVAVNYAMLREFTETPQNIIFYDHGSGSTTATLVAFSNITVKDTTTGKSTKTITLIDIKAIAFDQDLGGLEMDVRLRRHFVNAFQNSTGSKLSKPVYEYPRAMSRFLKEANRVKQILSANKDATASLENIMEDFDFRMTITREEFESLISDLIPRFDLPVKQVISEANLKLSDIEALVLVGGGTRVPIVQSKLTELVGEEKIAKTINADEAETLGAAYYGAGLSKQFRVKESRIKEKVLFPVQLVHETEPTDSQSKSKVIRSTLFGNSSLLGQKKIMTFKRVSDFDFQLDYANETPVPIVKYHVQGLTDALKKKLNDTKSANIKVRVTIQLTESGLFKASEAIAIIESETKPSSIKDKVKNFFGSGKENDKEEDVDVNESTTTESKNTPKSDTTASTSTSTDKGNTTTEENATSKVDIDKVNLKIKTEYLTVPPLTAEQKLDKRVRLGAMDRQDVLRREKDTARNNLEGFIYSTREFLENSLVSELSTEEQREELRTKLSETSDWLDEVDDVDVIEFYNKLTDLENLYDPINLRTTEHSGRSAAIERVQSAIANAKLVGQNMETRMVEAEEELRVHTPEEINSFQTLVTNTATWVEEKVKQQEGKKPFEEPAFLISELERKVDTINKEMTKLILKKPPKPKKKTPVTVINEEPSETKSQSESTPSPDEQKHDEL